MNKVDALARLAEITQEIDKICEAAQVEFCYEYTPHAVMKQNWQNSGWSDGGFGADSGCTIGYE